MDGFIRYINRIRRCLNLYRSKQLKEEKIDGFQYGYILRICRNPGIFQDQLSKEFYVNKSNVARHLLSLEKNGYIYRLPREDDRRSLQVFPTEHALRVLPLLEQTTAEWKKAVFTDLSEEESEIFMKTLVQIADKAAALVESEAEL